MTSRNEIEKYNIRTGDVILFCGNTPTGVMLKLFTSSVWNHVGIAVRLDQNKRVTIDGTGTLFILETNTNLRLDEVSGKEVRGLGYSSLDYCFRNYNKICIRRLKEKYRVPKLIETTENFYKNNFSIEFPNETMPFVNAWLGIKLLPSMCSVGKNKFCSQVAIEYYKIILDNPKKAIFESYRYHENELFTPEHFSSDFSPKSLIFEDKNEVVYTKEADMWFIITHPLFILLAIVISLWFIIKIFTSSDKINFK